MQTEILIYEKGKENLMKIRMKESLDYDWICKSKIRHKENYYGGGHKIQQLDSREFPIY